MNDSNDKKFENKYLEIGLMACNFLIPFFGLKVALEKYLEEDSLPVTYILLLLFIGGNIITSLIFILNEKSVGTKALWTLGLLVLIVLVNVLVW